MCLDGFFTMFCRGGIPIVSLFVELGLEMGLHTFVKHISLMDCVI